MQRTRHLACLIAAELLLLAASARAEYCLDYSSGVQSLARQSGSSSSRGCVATEQECKAALISNASSYRGSCYYVPGLYPPTHAATNGGMSSVDKAAKENDNAQKKIHAQQQAEERAEALSAQQTSRGLLQEIKGTSQSSPGLTIKIPAVQAAGKARTQLDCVQRASSNSKREAAAQLGSSVLVQGDQDDFENFKDCQPTSPRVPEVSAPVPVSDELPHDPQISQLLDSILARQRDARQRLDRLDRDIAKLEAEVKREENALKAETKTSPVESDALRRAREALAKARADRQKTAAEYDKLRQQVQAAREHQGAP